MDRDRLSSHSPWLSSLAGAAAGAMLLGIWYLLYGLRIAPFPPLDFADLLIRLAPGAFATWSIENFEHRAQPALIASAVACMLALWVVGGLLLRKRPTTNAGLVFGAILAPPLIALSQWSASHSASAFLWMAFILSASLAAAGACLGTWLVRLEADHRERSRMQGASDWLTGPGTSTRRALLGQVLTAALLVGGGGTVAGLLLRRAGVNEPATAAGTPLADLRAIVTVSGIPNIVDPGHVEPALPLHDNIELPVDARPRITSNQNFYVVDISPRKPVIIESEWRLRVHGRVERELSLTYADLLAEPAVDMYGTLMCISYTHANDLISSTLWTGVPLRQILQRAGLLDGIVDVVLRGTHGYSDSIPIAAALANDTILAYGMNGRALPREHGFPCRLYVPGLYGEKNVKWVQEIEVVDYDYKGYWQERGWTDIAIVNTTSAIDTPRELAEGGSLAGGFAFAGTRGIQQVELRVDEDEWQPADLEPYDPALLWQRWSFRWLPEPGPHSLTVRCTDGDGIVQTAQERDPHPDGLTGHHTVDVNAY